MCLICSRQDDFSFQHIEQEVKKIAQEKRFKKALEVKESIKFYTELLKNDDPSVIWSHKAAQETLEYYKSVQYILGRYM